MLDYFCIFTKSGALLWALSLTTVKGEPVNALIRECLLEERTGDTTFSYTSPSGAAYNLKWALNNALGIVFVAVYQKALKLAYVDELLGKVNASFSPRYQPAKFSYADFEPTFKRLLRESEERADQRARSGAGAPGALHHSHPTPGHAAAFQSERTDGDEDEADSKIRASDMATSQTDATDLTGQSEEDPHTQSEGHLSNGFDAALLSKRLAKRGGPGAKAAKRAELRDAPKPKGKAAAKPKVARTWNDPSGEPRVDAAALDFTEDKPSDVESETVADFSKLSLIDVAEEVVFDDVEEEATGASGAAKKPAATGFLSSLVRSMGVSVAGTSSLTREDIASARTALKTKLMERNVAEEIAEKVCESVAAGLEGRRLGSFTRVSTVVREAVEAALTRILTPKRSIDVLRGVREAKARGRPYTIVFVGVNGVGKSTNLAKVAYWLRQNGASVMIAACDTFRSGAVEQLKTHCARLGVPLFERGYEKDPAKVAAEAAKAAARAGTDVLLVDTAGRMQDNEPLMRALSNLISLNAPDLVLFVGEALVGNDAVDQLTKFNRRLADLSPGPNPHLIDGIVLTKFDTIDDKVGAALSMVYTSGAPIVFVGCGQTYVDLKRLHVKSIVAALLK
uniref:SRP54-type proteins GTP-binding domain-containing protein n=2 Tax=Auxenochlorella protothecoides TaxID=3075 RepID=A0A1D2AFE9_AUXPR